MVNNLLIDKEKRRKILKGGSKKRKQSVRKKWKNGRGNQGREDEERKRGKRGKEQSGKERDVKEKNMKREGIKNANKWLMRKKTKKGLKETKKRSFNRNEENNV